MKSRLAVFYNRQRTREERANHSIFNAGLPKRTPAAMIRTQH